MPVNSQNMVFLEYSFLFDPSVTWSHLYQFEKDLADFFQSKNLEAVIIKTVEGQVGKRILYIRKKEMAMPSAPAPVGRPKTIKGIIQKLSHKKVTANERDFKKGKLLKRKGYLKK